MKSLAEQMGTYSAYHRHPVNRAIHFVGIPAIVWSLMLLLGLVPLFEVSGLAVTAAHVAVVLLLAWYLALDLPLGIAATAMFTLLLVSALLIIGAWPKMDVVWLALGVHVVGWLVQFLGHGVWEKRRPALVDNLSQVFVAPIFLVAETAFAMGLRKGLHDEVRRAMVPHLPH